MVRSRIELLQKRHGSQELVIIVGRGSHSKDGVSKLQPAIMAMMERYQGPSGARHVKKVPRVTVGKTYQLLDCSVLGYKEPW